MSNTGPAEIAFGPFRLNLHERSLTEDGRPVAVGGRALKVLAALAAAAGHTVTKDELFARVWPGLTIEENNLQVHISALRKAIGSDWIVTVPGRGYRLSVSRNDGETSTQSDGRPSIAVLPFANLGGEVEQEYFADGIAHDLITGLSRNRSLMVIARNSSFSYRGRAVDVRLVAQELGVRYVIEGSVQRAGPRVRITAQLVDVETGSHIWANRYDRDLIDVLSVQDELTHSVITAIDPALARAERLRAMRRSPQSLGAWEAWQRALWHWSASDQSATRTWLQQAVRLNSRFAPARASLAWRYLSETSLGIGEALDTSLKLAADSGGS